MQIGAIGAGAYQPYIYNANSISRASMNKISRINDNLLAQKTDFSELANQQNVNPLKRGETVNFEDLMSIQMSLSRNNSARVLKTPDSLNNSKTDTVSDTAAWSDDTLINRNTDESTNDFERMVSDVFDSSEKQLGADSRSTNSLFTGAVEKYAAMMNGFDSSSYSGLELFA